MYKITVTFLNKEEIHFESRKHLNEIRILEKSFLGRNIAVFPEVMFSLDKVEKIEIDGEIIDFQDKINALEPNVE